MASALHLLARASHHILGMHAQGVHCQQVSNPPLVPAPVRALGADHSDAGSSPPPSTVLLVHNFSPIHCLVLTVKGRSDNLLSGPHRNCRSRPLLHLPNMRESASKGGEVD